MDEYKALKQEKLERQQQYYQAVEKGNVSLLRGSRYGPVRKANNDLVRLNLNAKDLQDEQE